MPDDGSIQPAADTEARKQAIAKGLAELRLAPVAPKDVELACEGAIKLPLGQITSLGAGFASLPEAFRTVTGAVQPQPGVQLFQALVPQDATLKQGKDGLFSSSAMRADGTPAWAKYQAVTPEPQAFAATVPVDPATLAMAAALAQINQKLDNIQDALDNMFDYLRVKDKADVIASLDTLSAILADYRFNWDNPQFKQAKYALVQSINRDARQHIVELRAHLAKKSRKKVPLELRGRASGAAEESLDVLKDYQLAVYLYSFSTFLGVMLLENYDQTYLDAKAADIRQKAIDYRQAYTACFDAIEARNAGSINNKVLGGVSAGLRGLGRLVEKTPVGDATPIDEALLGAGSNVGSFNRERNERAARLLIQAKDPAVAPFAQSIDAVNRIYNQPARLVTDGEALYLLPE